MPKEVTTIGGQLLQTDVILANSKKDGLKESMLKYNYDETRLAEGQALADALKALIEMQKSAYANQKQATRDLTAAVETAQDYFLDLVGICKQVMSPSMVNDLGVGGKRKNSYEGWTTEARNFYNVAVQTPGILAILENYGVTQALLEEGLALLDALPLLFTEQKDKKGLAQMATEEKDAKLVELEKWNSDFLFFAKKATRDAPQSMERFNYIVYSKNYKPSRNTDTTEEPPVEPPVEPPGEPPVEPAAS